MINKFEVKNINHQFFGAELSNQTIQIQQIPNFFDTTKNSYIQSMYIDS